MSAPLNPPAFPNTGNSTWNLNPDGGMTLRDWFASQALSGLVSAPRDTVYGWVVEHSGPNKPPPQLVAIYAYEIADAMLAERERGL